jgi:hypothetical protein
MGVLLDTNESDGESNGEVGSNHGGGVAVPFPCPLCFVEGAVRFLRLCVTIGFNSR